MDQQTPADESRVTGTEHWTNKGNDCWCLDMEGYGQHFARFVPAEELSDGLSDPVGFFSANPARSTWANSVKIFF